jgi:hypothetical protein
LLINYHIIITTAIAVLNLETQKRDRIIDILFCLSSHRVVQFHK